MLKHEQLKIKATKTTFLFLNIGLVCIHDAWQLNELES